jgi:hypothetical protein
MPLPPHSSWFYHTNNIGWAVKIIKLLIISLSPPLLTCPSYSQHKLVGHWYTDFKFVTVTAAILFAKYMYLIGILFLNWYHLCS